MEGKFFLEAIEKNDSSVIKTIYEQSFYGIKQFVLQNKGNSEDAEDVFQKALLQIAVRLKKEKFEIKSSFEGFLYTVCRNLWRRELNKRKNRVTNNEVIEQVSEERDTALSYLEIKKQELFVEKLGMLSENCRNILNLFFAKVPYAEILATTEYNSETVIRQRVFKCKKKLTELIRGDVRYMKLKVV
ncbi:RNA polymerase sigma factor, sigma-70 family [Tenacibaculum sp. MAR_2010_89]|uniref:RNA polymerase sigma factor n=1 Tax=Tenacibaculum sp. MAR_2010_89 TaxID=1250198 RepID=UPI00089B7757|nr:sigma-70 family RNA polymerase sigma factor [Tenacibaculum sp. MAR_2010_89]SED63388.1 RNA polymerase sigma factor, sigma-70 family [Tenacibaculum sp. MAR_2010_89]